jgi:sugar phosphate isomerase/epimerase
MKYAICNETFGDWPREKAFAFASDCGYTGVEIAPFTLGSEATAITPALREQVRYEAERAGLEVIGLHWLLAKTEGYHLTSSDEEVQKHTSGYLVALAKLCRDLGGQIMVFGSPPQRNREAGMPLELATDNAVAVLTAALPALEDLGVTLALEPLAPKETDFLTTAAETVALIERLDSTACRLHLDVKAMASETESAADLIRRYAAYLVHFHANDPNLQGPGFGEEDFAPIFAAFRQIDYSGWVSVEVFDYEPGIERLVRESVTYMESVRSEVH